MATLLDINLYCLTFANIYLRTSNSVNNLYLCVRSQIIILCDYLIHLFYSAHAEIRLVTKSVSVVLVFASIDYRYCHFLMVEGSNLNLLYYFFFNILNRNS